jgi:hypothetical protein
MKIFLTEIEMLELCVEVLDFYPSCDQSHEIALKMNMVYNEQLDMFEDVEEYSLRALRRAAKPEKHFLDMTKDEQEDMNEKDLREMALYYSGWEELKRIISNLEDNDAEAAYERHCTDY